MSFNTTLARPTHNNSRLYTGLADCLASPGQKTKTDWIIEQLHIQPYQHLLEIGFGTGTILQETAKKLQIGFLAGTDPLPEHYQQAYRRNKKMIAQQLLQLHIGDIADLPYPPHYFHTIYGYNMQANRKEPAYAFMQLSRMLKTNGRLVVVFQPRGAKTDAAVQEAAGTVRRQMIEAGLTDVRISYRDLYPVTGIAVTGCKP